MKTRKNITTKKLFIIAAGFMLLVATVFGILFGKYINVNADDRDPIIFEGSYLFSEDVYGERKVTDDGIEENPIDAFNCNGQFLNIGENFIDKGFDYVTVTLGFEMREINEGYQHIYLYSHSNVMAHEKLNYYGNTTKKDFNHIAIHFKTMNLMDFLDNNFNMDLVIRYDASGAGADTWVYKNMLIRVQLSHVVLRNETVKYGNV